MYKKHIFICTNGPEKPGKCGHIGGEKLWADVKQMSREQNWGPEVRVNKSGCLDKCSEGIACVVYPAGEWHLNLKENEAASLAKKLGY